MALYRISDLNVQIKTNSQTLAENIRPYEVVYKADPNITLEVNADHLVELMEENEGYSADVIECAYMSTLYSWALFDFNGFPIRAVGVEHNNRCVLFVGSDDIDINSLISSDLGFVYDYPGVRMEDDFYYVFDTPFGLNGGRSKKNRKLKLTSIVFVDSKRFDKLREIDSKDFVPLFMRAVSMNVRQERTKHTLFILERVMRRVKFYGTSDISDLNFVLERV